jgi:hypothetical protein
MLAGNFSAWNTESSQMVKNHPVEMTVMPHSSLMILSKPFSVKLVPENSYQGVL